MKDVETRLPARAMLVLLAVTILLSGFLLWRQIGSRVMAGQAAIQVAKNPEIRLIDYRGFPTCQKTDHYAGLQRRLARAVALDPGNRAAWQYLVKVRWASGDCAAVEAMLDSGPAQGDPSLAVIAALLDIQSDQFKGRASYSQAAELGKLLAETGKAADEAGLAAEAVRWYEAAFWLDPNLEVAEWLVSQSTTQANMPQVNRVWEYLAQEQAGMDDGWWAKFHLAELAGDLDGKITALESGAESSDDPYQFLLDLGHAYRENQQYDAALTVYRRAANFKPEVVWPVIFQGETYLEMKDLDNAEKQFALAKSIDPANAFGYYHTSLIYYQRGQVDDALNEMRRAIEVRLQSGIYPWTMSALLGGWYVKAGRCAEAKAAYEQALEWQPGEASVLENLQNLGSCK